MAAHAGHDVLDEGVLNIHIILSLLIEVVSVSVLPGTDLVECSLRRRDVAWHRSHLMYVHPLKVNYVRNQDLLPIQYTLHVMRKHNLTDIAKVRIDILWLLFITSSMQLLLPCFFRVKLFGRSLWRRWIGRLALAAPRLWRPWQIGFLILVCCVFAGFWVTTSLVVITTCGQRTIFVFLFLIFSFIVIFLIICLRVLVAVCQIFVLPSFPSSLLPLLHESRGSFRWFLSNTEPTSLLCDLRLHLLAVLLNC